LTVIDSDMSEDNIFNPEKELKKINKRTRVIESKIKTIQGCLPCGDYERK